jgi:uncharacterized membrane protein YvlD (DUF360 family)
MNKRFGFVVTVVALGAIGFIFGSVVSRLTSGVFAAAVAAIGLGCAYYFVRKKYSDDKTAGAAVLEALALLFVGALILYIVDAMIF